MGNGNGNGNGNGKINADKLFIFSPLAGNADFFK